MVAAPGLPDFDGANGPPAAVVWVVVWTVALLRRSRIAWWILVVLTAFGVLLVPAGALSDEAPRMGVIVFWLLYVASLLALLAAPTRRWVGVGHRHVGDG